MARSTQKQINEIYNRGKLHRTMQASSLERVPDSSSYNSEERESRTFPGNNRETSSESNSSRKRKGASFNSETGKLKRSVSINQETNDQTVHQLNSVKQGKHMDCTRRPMVAEINIVAFDDEEIFNMQTKQEEALKVTNSCLHEAGLSLSDRRNKITISREKEMEIRDKRKCQRESSKIARNSFDKKMFESILDKSSELVSKQNTRTKMRMKSLRNFYTEYGHFNVSSKSNGPLFNWLYEVKKSYKLAMQGKLSSGWKLTRERYNELVAIGFPFQSIRLPPVPQTSLDGSHYKSKTSRNEKDTHTKIPSKAENNPQSISAVSILQDANNKRTKKAASALSSSSESQFKKRSKKVHTTSEAKCPLAISGNCVPENDKQDNDCICHEPPKRIEKMRGSSEASVEKRMNLNEREYIRNTLASSNRAWEPIPYEADNTILLPQTQQFQQNLMNSTSMTSNTRTQIPTQQHNSSQDSYPLHHQQYRQPYQQPFHLNQYWNMQQQHFQENDAINNVLNEERKIRIALQDKWDEERNALKTKLNVQTRTYNAVIRHCKAVLIEEGKKKKTEMKKLSDEKITLQAKKKIIVDENEKLKKEKTKIVNEYEELLKENEKLKEASQISTQDVKGLENEGNQTEVTKRGKHLDLLRRTMQASSLERVPDSSSYNSEERESRTFPGNNRETSSESISSRKRKGASFNSETGKLKRSVSINQETNDQTVHQLNSVKQGKHMDCPRRPMVAEINIVAFDDEEIFNMQTKQEEALKVTNSCLHEAGLSLSDRRNKITISREKEMKIRNNIIKRKCQRTHLKTKTGDRIFGESCKMTRDSLATFSQTNKPQKQFNDYDADKLKCSKKLVTTPKQTCNEIFRENEQDQEIAQMNNEDKINALEIENSRLQETVDDLEDKLIARGKRNYETKRKLTDQYETLKNENEQMKKLLNERCYNEDETRPNEGK